MSTVVEDMTQTIDNSDLCVDCGNCCQTFWVNTAQNNAKGEKIKIAGRNKKWVEQDIEPVSIDEALALDLINYTRGEIERVMEDGSSGLYCCTLFDNETKRCTDYENRPVGCSQFPSYVQTGRNPYKDCPLYDQLKTEGKIK